MMSKTVKCPICEKPYTVHSHYVGDQSMCIDCREAAKKAAMRPSTTAENERRGRYFRN